MEANLLTLIPWFVVAVVAIMFMLGESHKGN